MTFILVLLGPIFVFAAVVTLLDGISYRREQEARKRSRRHSRAEAR